ncbi:CocE/NonD family hydrolase [Streptomyces sp. NA04227]|uniref:CocE/NonD family hydrolase n=1 Tax=Streptomyces sp. NA04227 TaxID=2742136 RepID=UPI0015910BA7|nr:CocE/NonD family hydrolase [Streptomyces sp. NA04227]QKW11268.1 CocE/NonD family hydrolase [Streptomyces sp. NA04227]
MGKSRALSARSRRALVLAVTASLAAPLTLSATDRAVAEEPPYSVTPVGITVDTGGEDCAVDADLYRPAGVDRNNPAPAVLITNGFGGSKNDGNTDDTARAFASRGYVTLVYSGLGFGRSGCKISMDDPRIDGRAASGLIDFLAGTRPADDGTRPDFVTLDGDGDPKVGMIGGSYGGGIQLATASRDPRLDAIVPMITWGDLAYSLAPNNGAAREVPGVYKWEWTNGFYLVGESQPVTVPNADPSRINSLACLHFVTDACGFIKTLNSGIYPQERMREILGYARDISALGYGRSITAPTLLIQGQADSLFTLNEAQATYRRLRAQGVDASMIWQSAGHSGGNSDPARGELNMDVGNLETSYVGRRILSWFDRHLRGRDVDTGPAFAYYRDWIEDPTATYATGGSVPEPNRRLYLSGDGKLVERPGSVVAGRREYRNLTVPTSHSESPLLRTLHLPDPEPYDLKGTHLAWTTAPLRENLDVVGAARVGLKVRSPKAEAVQNSGDAADKLVLFAKLYDVAPDGRKTLVHRLVAPVRVPDVRKSFTVELPGIVHRYQQGHRLQFVVAASDDAYLGNRGIKPVTVSSAPGDTGTLDLPVVEGK